MRFKEEPSHFSVGQTSQSLSDPSWRNQIQGWMTVWKCYCHAFEKGCLGGRRLSWKWIVIMYIRSSRVPRRPAQTSIHLLLTTRRRRHRTLRLANAIRSGKFRDHLALWNWFLKPWSCSLEFDLFQFRVVRLVMEPFVDIEIIVAL